MGKNSIDIWLFGSFFLLILLGIIMIYSSSAYYAEGRFGDNFLFIKRHLLWLFLGLIAMALAYNFPYQRLKGYSWILLLLGLSIAFYLAIIQRGRWISIWYIHFQGVDVAKFALIFFLADSLTRKEKDLRDYNQGFFPHFFYLLLFGALVVMQPDFSSACMLIIIGLAMLFASPVKITHLGLTTFVLVLLGRLVIKLFPYMGDRLDAHNNMETNLMGKAYQVHQSLVSFGAGGITGVGYAESKQKLFYLPEAHTDFIFSIIGEEWGIVGAVVVVMLFMIMMFRGAKIASRSTDRFSYYLAVGITAHFVIYAMMHMMVTLHLVPPTGLPLPFISYGGTFLFFSCIYAGLLLNISNRTLSTNSVRHQKFSQRASQNYQSRKLKYLK